MSITSFRGQHRWLSNFHPAQVRMGGEVYPTVEHAYQAAKTQNTQQRDQIRNAATAGQAKRLGRHVDLRDDWDEVKLLTMKQLIWQKFKGCPVLAKLLMDTGERNIEEGNTWGDTYWGTCNGTGQNHLGVILMQARAALNEGY